MCHICLYTKNRLKNKSITSLQPYHLSYLWRQDAFYKRHGTQTESNTTLDKTSEIIYCLLSLKKKCKDTSMNKSTLICK